MKKLLTVGLNPFFYSLLFAGVFLFMPVVQANDQNQLQTIQKNIAEQEAHLSQQKRQLEILHNELTQQEKAIAEAAKIVHQNKNALVKIRRTIVELTQGIAHLEQQYKQQQDYLAKQLDEAFRLGKASAFESMFDPQQAQRNERVLVYYSYLNEERKEAILHLKETSLELNNKKTQLTNQQQQQQKLVNQSETEQKKLTQNKAKREATRKELEKSLSQSELRLAELKENEQQLQQRILKVAQEAKARSAREARQVEQIRRRGSVYTPTKEELALMARTSGIGKPRGKLPWPVEGQVTHYFGQPLQGELYWKGMTIAAPEGKEVKAVAAGQVVLADWLQGYGLVIIIDHGKGDMSLYGYNQSALVNVGDKVTAGQSIALVGSSGGQGQSALYFEIRREGKALDPDPWLKK